MNWFFIILNSKFFKYCAVTTETHCSSDSLGHFVEQEILKLYHSFSSIYSLFLMYKVMWDSLT